MSVIDLLAMERCYVQLCVCRVSQQGIERWRLTVAAYTYLRRQKMRREPKFNVYRLVREDKRVDIGFVADPTVHQS